MVSAPVSVGGSHENVVVRTEDVDNGFADITITSSMASVDASPASRTSLQRIQGVAGQLRLPRRMLLHERLQWPFEWGGWGR